MNSGQGGKLDVYVQITSLTHDGYSEVLLYNKESLENLFGDGMNLREGMFGRD